MFKILLPYLLKSLIDYVRNPNTDNRELLKVIGKYDIDSSLFLKILQTIAHHYGVPLAPPAIERRDRPLDD